MGNIVKVTWEDKLLPGSVGQDQTADLHSSGLLSSHQSLTDMGGERIKGLAIMTKDPVTFKQPPKIFRGYFFCKCFNSVIGVRIVQK